MLALCVILYKPQINEKMAHSEVEKYYEADREKVPQISHANFAIENISDPDKEDTNDIIKYLETIEVNVKKLLSSNDEKFTNRTADLVFDKVYTKFKQKHSPVVIFDEFTAFFNLDYIKFFQLLSKRYKSILANALKNTVNLDTFLRIRKREQMKQTQGSYQPSFKKS